MYRFMFGYGLWRMRVFICRRCHRFSYRSRSTFVRFIIHVKIVDIEPAKHERKNQPQARK